MIIGVLRIELHVPEAQSLKDRRAVLLSLKDKLRGKFNVAVAEVESTNKWQRATIGIATLGDNQRYVDGLMQKITEWMRESRLVDLIRVEKEYW